VIPLSSSSKKLKTTIITRIIYSPNVCTISYYPCPES
jgi:hypothetical protein